MARVVEHHEVGPAAIAKDSIDGTHVYVCRCGLTRSAPFCDGSHKLARREDPGALVRYVDREGVRVPELVKVRLADVTDVSEPRTKTKAPPVSSTG